MEIRKVQLTGGSSYVITLPKDWVRALDIKKNDPVGLISQPDGTLVITSNTSGEATQRTKEVNVDHIDDPTFIYRLLLGVYVMGYNTIIIRSSSRIPPHLRESVITFTQMTMGPEIMEEDVGAIVIRDMLSPAEMPFDKTLRRMYILVRSMHEDAMATLSEPDLELAEEVVHRDNDVDRLHLLVGRQANMVVRDTTLAKKMGVSVEDAINYFLISRILERVGDHATKIENALLPLFRADMVLDRKVVQKVRSASTRALQILENSVDALLEKDIKRAHLTIDSVEGLTPMIQTISVLSQKEDGNTSLALGTIAESIRRTGEYAGDMSELVINNLIKYQ